MPTRLTEAGALRIFQLFAGLQLGVLLYTAGIFLTGLHQVAYHSPGQLVFMVSAEAVLFGYLLWPRPRRSFGAAHVPIAIGLSLCAPVFGQVLLALENHDFPDYLSVTGEMALFSLFPLLLTGWRYRFRYVATLAVGLGVVDLTLTSLAYPARVSEVEYGRVVFTRILGYLAIGYILTRLMREQRAQRAALRQANANLVHYAATLEQLTVSRERTRLARELHDTLAHTLSGLAVQLEGMDAVWDSQPGQARTLLRQALASTRGGLVETRRALQDMRATPLEDLGLREALRQCARRAAERAGTRLDLDLGPGPAPGESRTGDADIEGLPPDIEQGLYRVAQEALENVVKHAEARQIRVRLCRSGSRVTLTVGDDGKGFDPALVDQRRHLGLPGLRERAHLIGGDFEVRSRPGAGTTVRLGLDA